MEAASPVDRGWAWVVCAAGFFLHIAIIGTLRSTGILLAHVSEHYNRSKRDTSWIMAFLYLMFLLLSPITMVLARRYTVRRMVFIGGIFLTLGYSLSYFATSLEFLYVTIGLLVGTGMSLTHPTTVLLINYYFDRHRTVAMGITMAGGSAGSLCMPALMNLLVDKYTFRGCMLLWGGLMLNVAVAGALMRPFIGQDALVRKKNGGAGDSTDAITGTAETEEATERLVGPAESQAVPAAAGHCDRHCKSAENIHCRERRCSLRRATSVAALQQGKQQQQQQQQHQQQKQQQQQQHQQHHHLIPPKLNLLASCGDVSILVGQPASVAALAPEGENWKASLNGVAREEAEGPAPSLLVKAIRLMNLNVQLLRSPRFWFLLTSLGVAIQGMSFNFMVLPQHGKSIGLPASEYTRLLQYQGITDFVVRITIGFLADRQLIRRQVLMVVLILAQSALWCLLLHPVYSTAITFSLIEGILAGGTITNLAPILVDAFGVDNLPTSYGFLGVPEAVTMLIVPVLLGDMFDRTGSWNASIILIAILIGLSGVMLLTDDLLHQRSRKKQNIELPPC